MKKYKHVILVTFIVLLLMFFFEMFTYYIMPQKNERFPMFKLEKKNSIDFMNECCGYNEVDPLLGFEMTQEQIEKRGWKLREGCVYLENLKPDTSDTLKILITGGSTSDLALISENWPIQLKKILDKKGIVYEMFVGAVGGYSTSQEFLKLVRDGINIQPDIHISYNGANEIEGPYYVSKFEHQFFKDIIDQSQTSKIFPNIVYLLRSSIGLNKNAMKLREYPTDGAIEQYKKNMQMMNVLANGYGYKFIGILQPVAGIRGIQKYAQDEGTLYHVENYKKFYPDAIKYVDSSEYMHDFTTIFDTVSMPFFDDCHVKNEYQYIIANEIFDILGL